MEFGIKERLVLAALVGGQSGNISRLRILRRLGEEFSFSEEEFKKFDLQLTGEPPNQRYAWRQDKEELKEIEIGDEARKIIVERLKELNAQGQLIDDHLDVIDKFPGVEDA